MAEAFLSNPPVTVVREVPLTLRYLNAYFPSNARFDAGSEVASPVAFEVFIPEDRVRWDAIREHLATVPHRVFGRYQRTIFDWRTERRRVGIRIVLGDDVAAVFCKLKLG